MRVGLVIERFAPGAGGAENVAWQIARGLVRAGDEVVVVARCARELPGIELRRVAVSRAWQPLRVARFDREAAAVLSHEHLDCVLSLTRTRRQHVYRAGGGSHADYLLHRYGRWHRLLRASPRHAVLLAAERRIFRDPRQRILCISQMVRDEIRERYRVPEQRLAVIHNGVDLERFHPRNRRRSGGRLRRELDPGAGPRWLFAGSGFARKGLDTALRALASARAADARLWVAGRDAPGRWRRLARRLGVANRVRFVGYRADLPDLYAAADALLLPSRYDAFANVCLEAAATGIPVVTSGATGAAELFRDGGTVVEDPEDVAAFAAALDRLSDRVDRERRGAACREIAAAFGWDSHVRALREELARAAA